MILVALSDSHGSTYSIDAALEQENKIDALVFCGDVASDADYIRTQHPHIPLYAVRGNNDFFCDDPFCMLPVIGGIRLYITHGHKERVKFGCYELLMAAKAKDAKLVLFGHTHAVFNEEIDGVRLINPGSIHSSRGSYARIEIINDKISSEIKTIG